jgi:hypothetical protein
MTFRSIPLIALSSVLFALSSVSRSFCTPPPTDPSQEFKLLLQKIAAEPPDPCNPPNGLDVAAAEMESSLFGYAASIVTRELNADPTGTRPPQNRATEALKKLERLSAEINAAWPAENRFHFEVLDLSPALVVKMTIRTHNSFFVFGIPEESSGKPNRLWQGAGSDDDFAGEGWFGNQLDLYPLHRGPSGNARFLALFTYPGCAGNGIGIAYEAREWDPKSGSGYSATIIKQAGSLGLAATPSAHGPTPKNPFAPIGELKTEGPLITLPYCWFSAIDTWDNPSMCAADTYDLSGNNVRFRSRAYNRPDLVPIAKAIEYAQQRDFPAVLAYCASAGVARRLVRDIPPDPHADDLRVIRTGEGKERVEFSLEPAYRFDVEKRAGRWLVVAFSAE